MNKTTSLEGFQPRFSNRALTALIIPLFFEQLLTVFVGMADSIMIASVGEAAVSGVSLVDNVFLLIIQMLSALATGGAVVIGQYLGNRDEKAARRAADQLIAFLTVLATVIMILTYLGQDLILHGIFGAIEADVFAHAKTYLLICAASIPGIALYGGAAAIYRAQGDSRTPMLIACVMNAINISGNALLIYGLGFGTAGVAIPTLVSRIVAAVIGIVLLSRKNKAVYLQPGLAFRFKKHMISKILSIGIPNGIENSLFQLGKLVVLNLIASFGTSAIAANAVSMAVANFQILPGISISFAMVTVVSQCIGAGDEAQAKYYTKKLMIITYITMAIMDGLTLLALPAIISIYHLTAQTADTATLILMTHGICAILIWPVAFTLPSAFRATGNALFPMVFSIISMVLGRIIFAYIFAKYMNLGVYGTWLAMILDWVLRAIAFSLYARFGNKPRNLTAT